MSIQVVNPIVSTTPNIGGSSAVTGITNTGHSDTLTNTSAVDVGIGPDQENTVSKSAKWSSFGSFPAGTINSLHLKLNWEVEGDVSATTGDIGAGADSDITFTIDYSLDGGSNWTNALTKTRNASAASGSSDSDSIDESGAIDVTLMTSQNVSLVQVRTLAVSHCFASAIPGTSAQATAQVTTNLNDIKLEADITLAASSNRKQVINFF